MNMRQLKEDIDSIFDHYFDGGYNSPLDALEDVLAAIRSFVKANNVAVLSDN